MTAKVALLIAFVSGFLFNSALDPLISWQSRSNPAWFYLLGLGLAFVGLLAAYAIMKSQENP
jgi:hypothetical protein